jgi:choline dehydrogenase
VLPTFIKSEHREGAADSKHGSGGEWRVERQRLSWKVLDVFRQAAGEHGIPPVDDFNTGDNEGVGYFEVNQRKGIRWSAARGFLKPALKRPNLTLWTHAQVLRLLVEGGRVVGAEIRYQGKVHALRAGREVILSAGAVNSPHLLQVSGIGAPELLQSHGVDVVHALPGVGENLQDHLQLRLIFGVEGLPTLNITASRLLGKIGMGLQYAAFRRGPMTMAPSQLGAFAKSSPEHATANVEYHVQPLSLDKFGEPLHPYPAFTASVCNLRPQSRGHIRLKSPDPTVPPAIQPRYLTAGADRRVAIDAIKLTRRIVLESKAFAPYRPKEMMPGPSYATDEELAHAAGQIGTTIFHPVGTAKWATTRWRWSMQGCACAGLQGCAWRTRRSCRRSLRATPTRRPS